MVQSEREELNPWKRVKSLQKHWFRLDSCMKDAHGTNFIYFVAPKNVRRVLTGYNGFSVQNMATEQT
jgi:hypothetical protein